MQRYGPNHQRQRQRQVQSTGNVHIHHEGVLHSDDGTVQDGRGHRGDLEQFALPALALPLRQRVSSQIGHQLLDLFALALSKEGLGLVQSGFGHHDPGRTVLHLGEDLDRLALERREKRSVCRTGV